MRRGLCLNDKVKSIKPGNKALVGLMLTAILFAELVGTKELVCPYQKVPRRFQFYQDENRQQAQGANGNSTENEICDCRWRVI